MACLRVGHSHFYPLSAMENRKFDYSEADDAGDELVMDDLPQGGASVREEGGDEKPENGASPTTKANEGLLPFEEFDPAQDDAGVSHPLSKEQVELLIDLNREIILKRFEVCSDGTIKWTWLLPAPLWLCLAVLAHEKKANVFLIIFDNPEVYRELQCQVRRHPEIFRILRDDLKMIDLPKYLNVNID